MMAMQKAELDKMMRRGGTDPWAVDFNKNLEGKDIQDSSETLQEWKENSPKKDSAVAGLTDAVSSKSMFSF